MLAAVAACGHSPKAAPTRMVDSVAPTVAPGPEAAAQTIQPEVPASQATADLPDASGDSQQTTDPSKDRWQPKNALVAREETDARVLLYHSFGWFSVQRPAVSPTAFKSQLDFLAENEIEVVPLGALLDFLEGKRRLPKRIAVITIDDGERNGYTTAFPILKERGLPFTVAIATEAVVNHDSRGTMTWAELKELVASGLATVANHSHTHRNLTRLGPRHLELELVHSRELIERHVGVRPEAFIYPLGAHNRRVQRAVEAAGYRAGFAAVGAKVHTTTNRFAIPRWAVEKSTGLYVFGRYFRKQ